MPKLFLAVFPTFTNHQLSSSLSCTLCQVDKDEYVFSILLLLITILCIFLGGVLVCIGDVGSFL